MTRKKILLVDDSGTQLMLAHMVFAKHNYDLIMGRNGREAVDKALAEAPDVIVMDVNMPVMDGLTACKRLRNHPSTATVPIVLLTTKGAPEDTQKGFAAGCSAYLTKPINVLQLLSKVRELLHQKDDGTKPKH